MVPVRINVDAPGDLLATDAFGAGALIRVENSSDAVSYSELVTLAIVSGTEHYTAYHAAGTSATYYRVRYSKASPAVDADYSAYSDVFQAAAEEAYATLDDLDETMDIPMGAGSSSRRNLLTDLLADGRAQIDSDTGRTFLRVPQVSGTVTVYCDVRHRGHASLVSAIGHPYTADGRALDIVSITTIKYRDSEAESTYTAVAAGDTGYYLDAGTGPGLAGTDWPYEDVTLSPSSDTITTWPTGRRAVEIVGALGFPRIPAAVRRANVDKAREAYRQGPGGGPSQVGVNQFGTPMYVTGAPASYRELVRPGSVFLKRSWRSV